MALGPYRTTETLVSGIVETEAGFDLIPFIVIANQIATDLCGGVNYSPPYDDGFVNSKMELIERWLSAHFYQMFDNALASAKAGSVAASFVYKVGFGLKLTAYGQQAMLLDTGLNLAKQDNVAQTVRKIKIGGDWLGRKDWCWPGNYGYWFDGWAE